MAAKGALPVAGIPTPRTPPLGRETELVAARAILLDDAVRLLSLTGTGGVSKTRLALAIAHGGIEVFADGVVWVEPLFAEAKDWHVLRRFRLRGLANVNIQGLLIAAGQNVKRFLATTGWGRRHAPYGSLVALLRKPQRLSTVSG